MTSISQSRCFISCTSLRVKHRISQPFRTNFRFEFFFRTHPKPISITPAALRRESDVAREFQESMGYWLLKTEPGEWGWADQEKNGGISNWDGVRNALAQKHLRSMQLGDHAFFYHSGKGPSVVGVVEVVKVAYPDNTDESGKSCMVDVRALAALPKPVPLSAIKNVEELRDWILLRQSRLSVMPVSPDEWQRVCELGNLSPPPCLVSGVNGSVSNTQPAEPKKANPKRRSGVEEKGDAVMMAKKKTGKVSAEVEAEPKKRARRLPPNSSNGIPTPVAVDLESVKSKDQPSQLELSPVAELKTYRRSSRSNVETTTSAPTLPKPIQELPRGRKKLPRDKITE
ncbi:uncharacterized protein [Physcomitrium patens]|uniref:EVE domain-containing protein n=1 Tax=Physcomitrium patens TaxID=3218 RepID=A0A2K1JYJ7_PHYPA|nr:uncharacterized protein LOC112287329 [Physcomitrium patens]PNR46599.1 hypothetical protein PHYPA_013718 [Physcomitrium patens]|eukprot:XP_024385998.1 uncharacterized protein LOC112287329 [Physcomitrella patens]